MSYEKELEEYVTKYYETREKNEDLRKIRIREKLRDILDGINNNSIDNMEFENMISLPIETIGRKSFIAIIKKNEERDTRLKNVSYTKAYKCYKCGNNDTTVVYVQTRSSDEPMTAFITCVHCKNQFKN